MKKIAMILLACMFISHALLSQTTSVSTSSKTIAAKRAAAVKKAKNPNRLLCDVNFTWTRSTSAPYEYFFSAENPVPGYVYTWYFSDSTSAPGTSATHDFSGTGTYTVCFEAYSEQTRDTCRECITLCLNDVSSCISEFNWTASTSSPGMYTFAVESPVDGVNYTWLFGDNKRAEGTTTSHTYTTAGNYSICLGVYDEDSKDTCWKCVTICVNQVPACWANFVAEETPVSYEYSFKAESATGVGVSGYYWDFGDGRVAEGAEVSNEYSDAGLHTVCLTIIYENDCVGSYCADIMVVDPSIIEGRTMMAQPVSMPPIPGMNNAGGNSIKVSPNPVYNNNITVRINAGTAGTYRYKIFSTTGEPAATGTISLNKGVQHFGLDVKALRPGKYWIEFSNSREQQRTAFIKL